MVGTPEGLVERAAGINTGPAVALLLRPVEPTAAPRQNLLWKWEGLGRRGEGGGVSEAQACSGALHPQLPLTHSGERGQVQQLLSGVNCSSVCPRNPAGLPSGERREGWAAACQMLMAGRQHRITELGAGWVRSRCDSWRLQGLFQSNDHVLQNWPRSGSGRLTLCPVTCLALHRWHGVVSRLGVWHPVAATLLNIGTVPC